MSNDDDIVINKNILKYSKQTANTDLGITQQYTGNRKLWDSKKEKDNFRNEAFQGKQTIIDTNTGNVLHKSHDAAKAKYHQKNSYGENVSKKWAQHAAEVDHKVSLESLHGSAKYNAFLTDKDLNEIANGKHNYQLLSKSENASKGADNSVDIKTHAELQKRFAERTAINAGKEFADGAKDSMRAAVVDVMISSVEQIVIEDRPVNEVGLDAVKAVGSAAVVGGAEKILIDATTHFFVNSGNEVLQSIVQQNAVGQVLTMGVAVGNSLVRYLDGEIDEKELSEEIALNGSIILISTIVSAAIPVPLIGPLVSFVATNVATTLYETNKHMDDYLIQEKQIKRIEREAITLMEEKREQFKLVANKEFEQWDSTVSDGFYQLLNSSLEENFSIDSMVSGLDKILSLCGTQAAFHSVEEYVDQLDQPLSLCF